MPCIISQPSLIFRLWHSIFPSQGQNMFQSTYDKCLNRIGKCKKPIKYRHDC